MKLDTKSEIFQNLNGALGKRTGTEPLTALGKRAGT